MRIIQTKHHLIVGVDIYWPQNHSNRNRNYFGYHIHVNNWQLCNNMLCYYLTTMLERSNRQTLSGYNIKYTDIMPNNIQALSKLTTFCQNHLNIGSVRKLKQTDFIWIQYQIYRHYLATMTTFCQNHPNIGSVRKLLGQVLVYSRPASAKLWSSSRDCRIID